MRGLKGPYNILPSSPDICEITPQRIVHTQHIMAPALSETPDISESHIETPKALPKGLKKEPLQPKGALDAFKSFDVTPVIGREYPTANLKEWLQAPNSDELLRELAITGEQPWYP